MNVFASQRSKLSIDEASFPQPELTLTTGGTTTEKLRKRILLLLEKTQNESTLLSVLRTLEKEHGCGSETVSSTTDLQSIDAGPCSFSQLGAKFLSSYPIILDKTVTEGGADSSHIISENREESENEDDSSSQTFFAPDQTVLYGQQHIHSRRAAVSAESLPLSAIQSYKPPIVEKNPETEEIIRASLMASQLFSHMESSGREVVVKAMKKEQFPAGSYILRQGGPSKKKLFLITEGTCEVIKNGEPIDTLYANSIFGETEVMYQQAVLAATVRSVTNCTVYTLDQEIYQRVVLLASLEKRRKYADLISNVGFLRKLPRNVCMQIGEALTTKTYRKNDYIIRFGKRDNWVHFIVEGEVKVVGRNQGKKCDILRIKEGDVVGELEFVFNQLAVADVVAVSERVVTAHIHPKHLELIAGSLLDDVKEYIGKNKSYMHYLGEENERIKDELFHIIKRSKRKAVKGDKDIVSLDKVDPGGEIIIPVIAKKSIDETAPLVEVGSATEEGQKVQTLEKNGQGGSTTEGLTAASATATKHILYRFPLVPLHTKSLAMIGLREDGTILMWNDMMTRFTGYTADKAIGQHIFSFLLRTRDQRNMFESVGIARHYTGKADIFMVEKDTGYWICYSFPRIDGLTEVQLKLTVLPSLISPDRDGSKMVLAVGQEFSGVSHKTIKTQVLRDQIRSLLGHSELTHEDCFLRITAVLNTFDWTNRAVTVPTEDIRVVNIRHMIGQVIMDYGVQCVANATSVRQRFEGLYTDTGYVDAKSLPECLRYAMENCSKHLDGGNVTITVTITENSGFEFLVILFHDDGPGLPSDLLGDFYQNPAYKKYPQINRVRSAMAKQGGSMLIESVPGDTRVTFVVPFIPETDSTLAEESVTERVVEGLLGSCSTCLGSQGSLSPAPSASMSNAEKLPTPPSPLQAQHTFTTVVVEDVLVHRNMLCSFLWDEKHTVLPAYNISDIEQLIDVADILFIDPHQSIFANGGSKIDPITLLRVKARRMAVVITGTDIDEVSEGACRTAGFLTLKKPCTSSQALRCIRLAEKKIAQQKLEAERVIQARETLSRNIRGSWRRGELLGTGVFGKVYEATEVSTGCKMAVKEIRVEKHNLNREQFVNEISTMCNLHHPNIIHYFYCEENKERNVVRVFMEYASGGNLQQLLQRKGKLDFKEFQSLLHDIVEGVAYIHSVGHVHCDLKTANILLSSDGKGKIGDFGTARTVKDNELIYQMQGSLLYMSPECMSAGDMDDDGIMIGYSFPSDIWSLGCIALEIATSSPPFSHLQRAKGPVGHTKYITTLHDTPDLSPLFDGPPCIVEFVSACLNPDPLKRATADDLRHLTIFSEAPDENMKSALSALKRAQLLQVFNSFVAFQETEEIEHQRMHCSSVRGRQLRCGSDFFDSSSSSRASSVNILSMLPLDTAGVNKKGNVGTDGMELISEKLEDTQRKSSTRMKSRSSSASRCGLGYGVEDTNFFAQSLCSVNTPSLAAVASSFPDGSLERIVGIPLVSPMATPSLDYRNSFALPNLSIHFMGTSIDAVSAGPHEYRLNPDSFAPTSTQQAPHRLRLLYPQRKENPAPQLSRFSEEQGSSHSFESMLCFPASASKTPSSTPQLQKRKMKVMFSIEILEPSVSNRNFDISRSTKDPPSPPSRSATKLWLSTTLLPPFDK